MKKLKLTAVVCLFAATSAVLIANKVKASELAVSPDGQDSRSLQVDLSDRIRALDSTDPMQRASAACALRALGPRAAPAIPSLIKLLGDDSAIGNFQCGKDGLLSERGWNDENTPGKMAALALVAIGDEAIAPLINHLRNSDLKVRLNSAFALSLIKTPTRWNP